MNDLIYRETLKDKLLELENEVLNFNDYNEEERIRNTGIVDGIEACLDELDNVSSVFHKPEEKPREDSRVLVWFKSYRSLFATDFILLDSAYYSKRIWSTGFDEDAGCCSEIPQQYIVAWMYFPELPDDFI